MHTQAQTCLRRLLALFASCLLATAITAKAEMPTLTIMVSPQPENMGLDYGETQETMFLIVLQVPSEGGYQYKGRPHVVRFSPEIVRRYALRFSHNAINGKYAGQGSTPLTGY